MDILILLLGGNPLPNFIVADYLLNLNRVDQDDLPVPSKILLVSTERTEKFYNSIINLLRKKHSENFPHTEEIKLNDKHRLPESIQNKIKKAIENQSDIDSIHLSYTGGTKPMAANAFAAAIEVAQEKIKLILSDLDPDNFKLTSFVATSNNKMIEEKNFPGKGDLRDCVHLNIDEIFELHEMKLTNGKSENPILKNNMIDIIPFSLAIVDHYKTDIKGKDFLEISKGISQKDPKRNEKIVYDHPYLKGIFDEKYNLIISPGHFNQFICGKWLEYYLNKSLEKINNELNIKLSIGMNVEAEYEKRNCEIDVIAMKGHQVFLFSCTTSQKIKIVKQKAFEALFRAEQLGGEHAKVIVVSTMFNIPCEAKLSWKNNLKELEKDIKQFNADQKCELIGIDELSNEKEFLRKLKDIITQN
ncbi:MAG: hypothetical protein MUF15_19195 [Acidobacteria bacterium]|nr:hypothetical protein [Acidobacteriota bacterium]